MSDIQLTETQDYDKSATPLPHHASHENGGSDEISLAGLTLPGHHTTHENGGSDELDVFGLIFPSLVIANLSEDQTIPTGAFTLIEFDVATLDRNSDFDTTNHRFEAPEDGKYYIAGFASIQNLDDGEHCTIGVKVNGDFICAPISHASHTYEMYMYGSVVAELSEGDYVTFVVYHNHGSNRTLNSSIYETQFSVMRLY